MTTILVRPNKLRLGDKIQVRSGKTLQLIGKEVIAAQELTDIEWSGMEEMDELVFKFVNLETNQTKMFHITRKAARSFYFHKIKERY